MKSTWLTNCLTTVPGLIAPGKRIASGMQFVGTIIGDYAKTAINTGIFTGKTVGACSMAYGFVTTNVPSFVNYARLFTQVTEIPPPVMIKTQARLRVNRFSLVCGRRNKKKAVILKAIADHIHDTRLL